MKEIDIRGKIKTESIFEDLTKAIDPYKTKHTNSITFLVDSSPSENAKILITYPGKKVQKRTLSRIAANSVLWQNAYDFAVVPVFKGQKQKIRDFTFEKMLRDFETQKKQDGLFWEDIVALYQENKISVRQFPELSGINAQLFLYVLKWLWIQEDLNYKLNHNKINCPTRYKTEKTGVGRGKFFAALLLVKSGYFTTEDCKKIIALY
jgi:hypothetical protein